MLLVGAKCQKSKTPDEGEFDLTAVDDVCLREPLETDECAMQLDYKEFENGSIKFGMVCRYRVCTGHGDCMLSEAGHVVCLCDVDAIGDHCAKRP